MNANKFLEKARQGISDDPYSRLTEAAKSAINDPECNIDVHAHIFDRKCLTVAYILLRLLTSKLTEVIGIEGYNEDLLLNKSEEEIYKKIELNELEGVEDWDKLEKEVESVSELMVTAEIFGFDLKEAFKVLKKNSMKEVLDYYLSKFSILNIPPFSNNPLVTGILMMDLETGWGIKPKKKFHEQIDEIKEISKVRPILPFFAIDPRRAELSKKNENLYELFLKAFVDSETPFFGVKCYPSLGYLPSDKRLEPIFKICAEKNIPVLTHCGGTIVSTFKKVIPVKNSTGIIDYEIPGNSRQERADFLNNPAHWDSVLNQHLGLKLNLAHFGGDTNWEELGNNGNNARIDKIMQMMANPNWKVYADFSFNVAENNLYNIFQSQLDSKPKIASKTLYGTDYWVVLPVGDLLEKQKQFLLQMASHSNNLLRTVPRSYLFS